MRALVTGLDGFSGKYLRQELEQSGYEIFGLYRWENDRKVRTDLRDSQYVQDAVSEIKPDVVFHLAAQSMASLSWKSPRETIEVNIVGTVNLLEALRTAAPSARLLLIGSSEQYGTPDGNYNTISEEIPLSPQTPYAVSKCAQEYLGKIYFAAYGMHICMTRTFSFGGSGQRKGFVLSDFASGIAAVEAGICDSLPVGNLDARRDFTHIKDVVRAYRLIVEKGAKGEVYNVGSGQTHTVREVLQEFLRLASCEVQVVSEQSRKRPQDIYTAPCNHDKLTAQTGWKPALSFVDILADELDGWRREMRTEELKGD